MSHDRVDKAPPCNITQLEDQTMLSITSSPLFRAVTGSFGTIFCTWIKMIAGTTPIT
jgi:hypothetical protein